MSPRIPAEQWTDDEWFRVVAEFPPDSPSTEAEAAVYQWRHADG